MRDANGNIDPSLEAFTLTLRNAALNEADVNMRYALKGAADLIDDAIDDLVEFRNAVAMVELNGAWSYAVRLLNVHREPQQPQSPQSAQADADEQRKVA